MVLTASLCQLLSTPKPTVNHHHASSNRSSSNNNSSRRRPIICLVPQAGLQVRTKLILLMVPLLRLTMMRAVIR
jgi:hypothetical protein